MILSYKYRVEPTPTQVAALAAMLRPVQPRPPPAGSVLTRFLRAVRLPRPSATAAFWRAPVAMMREGVPVNRDALADAE